MLTAKPESALSENSCLRPFGTTARFVSIAWLACALLLTLSWMTFALFEVETFFKIIEVSIIQCVAIALASLVIAIGSLIPGIVREYDAELGTIREFPIIKRTIKRSLNEDDVEAASLGILPEFVVSGLLRLVATVALFMICRYCMPVQDKLIAAWVLGWYLVLALTEVIVLSKVLTESLRPDPIAPLNTKPALPE